MELIVKHFSELSAEELVEIYKLRVSVFIVEQSCPYQDIDDADNSAYHVWLRDEDGIEAYARVLPAGVAFPTAAIGRVIAVKLPRTEWRNVCLITSKIKRRNMMLRRSRSLKDLRP